MPQERFSKTLQIFPKPTKLPVLLVYAITENLFPIPENPLPNP